MSNKNCSFVLKKFTSEISVQCSNKMHSSHYYTTSTSGTNNNNKDKSSYGKAASSTKSPLRVMPYPVRSGNNSSVNAGTASKYPNNNNSQKENDKDLQTRSSSAIQSFGASPGEKMRIFTGTIDRVMKWNKILDKIQSKDRVMCLYEVIASIVSMQNGSVKLERIILLRDDKGPIMQVVHYLTYKLQLDDFFVGQKVRVVGRMIGYNKMNAISIRDASIQEVEALPRHCHIADYAISRMLKDDERAAAGSVLLH